MLNAFTNGEVSPKFRARTDTQEYQKACETIENATVLRQGGAQRRAGFQLIDVHTGAFPYATRIIPFIISENEAYLILLTEGNAPAAVNYSTLSKLTVTAATLVFAASGAAANDTADLTEAEMFEVQYAQNNDILVLTHPSMGPVFIYRTAIDALSYTSFFNIGDTVGAVATTYHNKSWGLKDQNLDTAKNFRLSTLALGPGCAVTSRDAGGTAIDFFTSGMIGAPMLFVDISNKEYLYGHITAVADAQNATMNVFSTTAATANLAALYVGAVQHHEWWQAAWTDDFGFPKSVTFNDDRLLFAGTDEEPGRIWGTQVSDIYEVVDLDVETLGVAAVNSDYYKIDLRGSKYQLIQWMKDSTNLIVGTDSREQILAPSDPTDVIGRANAPVNQAETEVGSSYVQPELVNNTITFVNRSGQQIRDVVFNERENSFFSRNITVLAEHIHKIQAESMNSPLKSKIVQMVFQESDNGILWAIDNNGGLMGATIDKELGIRAWHSHNMIGTSSTNMMAITSAAATNPIQLTTAFAHGLTTDDSVRIRDFDGSTAGVEGTHAITVVSSTVFSIVINGSAETGMTNDAAASLQVFNSKPKFLSLTVLPSVDRAHDTLWATVQISVDNVDEVYLVRQENAFEGIRMDEQSTSISNKPVFSDLSIMNQVASFPSGTATTAHTGFSKLANETVQVLADGAYIGDKLVSSTGTITLDDAAREVIAGLKYETRIKLLPIDAGSAIGTALGAIKNIDKAIVKFFRTVYAKIGRDRDDSRIEEIIFREFVDPAGPPTPKTGEKEVDFSGDYERSSQIEIFSDLPYPMIVNGVISRGITYD